jgi:hypothetical protein
MIVSMRVAALLVVLAVLVSGCVSTKAPAEVQLSNEVYTIRLFGDYTMYLSYDFTAKNYGGSDTQLEFSINPGFQHPTCWELAGEKRQEVNCSTEISEEGSLQRKLRIGRPIKPGDNVSFSLDLYGCPIMLSYEPFLKGYIYEISSYWLVNHRYETERDKMILLSIPDPAYPVVVGEGVEPFGKHSDSAPDGSLKRYTMYSYTAESFFRACVSDFAHLEEERDGVRYRIYLAPSDRDLLPWVLSATSGAVERYSELFHPYPFKEYTVLAKDKNRLSGGGDGGANYTIYNTISSYYLLVHEVGHAWFGSMIEPAGERDRWLSEGAATYCELVMGEGRDDFREHLREMQIDALRDDGPVVREDPSMWGMYKKGAMMFRMLQYVMGDAFPDLMHTLFQRYNGKQITTEDFVALANKYGDYQWFFDQWLYRGGAPDYSIKDIEYGNGTLTFRVVQEGETYRMPLDIAFIMDDGEEVRERVLVYEREELFSFVTDRPAKIVLDPDMWVLKRFDKSEDPDSTWTYILP